uniref:Uncharacterized protein n=1 Tax=Arundo donax TaxID=35708 RepID=A0A0A8XNY4_ARUDO
MPCSRLGHQLNSALIQNSFIPKETQANLIVQSMFSFICSLCLFLCISCHNRKQKTSFFSHSLVVVCPFFQIRCLLFFFRKDV